MGGIIGAIFGSWQLWLPFLIVGCFQPFWFPVPIISRITWLAYKPSGPIIPFSTAAISYRYFFPGSWYYIFLWLLDFLFGYLMLTSWQQTIWKARRVTKFIFYGTPVFFFLIYNFGENNPIVRFLFTGPNAVKVWPKLADKIGMRFATLSLIVLFIDIILFILFKVGILKSPGLTQKIEEGKLKNKRPRRPIKIAVHEKYFFARKEDENYLGYNFLTKLPEYMTIEQRLLHTQITGATGTGKTESVILPLIWQDIIANRGIIFIDAKGDIENAKKIYEMAKENNREQDFLLFSIAHPELSRTYNPLQYGDPTQLKDKITGAIEWSQREPFFQRKCENALQTLFMEHGDNPITLKELYSILQNPPAKYHDFSNIKEQNQKNITTLEDETNLLITTTFSDLFSEPKAEIDLLGAYKNKKIIYFAIDTQSYGATAIRLGRIITQDINTLSGIINNKIPESERQPFGIFIDEYQAFGTKQFINCLARGRASGFMITIAHQSICDLDAIDPFYREQVLTNTHTKIYLKANDTKTAEAFSKSLGTEETIMETHQEVIQGVPTDQKMGTEKIENKHIIPIQWIRELKRGECAYNFENEKIGILTLLHYSDKADNITLPQRRKSNQGQGKGQETQPEQPPQPPKSVF